jgi:hypothetical protein
VTGPWRAVTSATLRTNHRQTGRLRGAVISREWVLRLECGHETTRYVRVKDGPEPYGVRLRAATVNPPKRAACDECLMRILSGEVSIRSRPFDPKMSSCLVADKDSRGGRYGRT